ncbi:S41 family peptidase [Dyella sp. C9]|uniref:S41 family peptidase n=1 Tax=Dyella sp. C9 TaxID=2202154 RepID=UPI000DEEF87F|nr:S41 family peptidase [Dyella sp. C9]
MDCLRRVLLFAALASLGATATARATQPTTTTTDVAAFARLYGVVRYYYPGDAAQSVPWNRFAIYGVTQVRDAHDSKALAASLHHLFDPIAGGIDIVPDDQPFPAAKPADTDQPHVHWQRLGYAEGVNAYATYQAKRTARAGVFANTSHPPPNVNVEQQREASARLMAPQTMLYADASSHARYAEFPLGAGLKARVPIDLTDDEAKASPEQQQAVAALATSLLPVDDAPISAAQRQADIVMGWNVYRHFYPYWREVGDDWDQQLEPLLALADTPASRETQRDTLRRMVALVQDGHGQVYDPHRPFGSLPVVLEPVGDALVVTASANPTVRAGDRVTSVDGLDAPAWMARQAPLVSGSPQWRRWQVAAALQFGPIGKQVQLDLERDGHPEHAALDYQRQTAMPAPARPEPVTAVKDGVWYVDITRASQEDFERHLDQLGHARALIVDLRGYPRPGIGRSLLEHLLAGPEHARWMHMARHDAPFDQPAAYNDIGWDLSPATPRITAKVVVLTDGQAISQAESLLGYVSDLHLATIVGSPSAGTNGDVQVFYTPSGYRISFTGLRVTRHDGSTPFHGQGVEPDVALSPSLADLRAGRDVVLEQALQLCR